MQIFTILRSSWLHKQLQLFRAWSHSWSMWYSDKGWIVIFQEGAIYFFWKTFTRDLADYANRLQTVCTINSSGTCKERIDGFYWCLEVARTMVSCRLQKWLLLLRIIFERSQKVANMRFFFLQYMKVTHPINIVGEVLSYIHLRFSTGEKVKGWLGQGS